MIIKKRNKIVGIINILLGILVCLNCFIFYSCMKMEEITYIYFTSEQDSITKTLAILMFIPIINTFIINLIYIFKNWKNKKSMILNILSIIIIILSMILTFVFEFNKGIYIISIIAILGILLLIFNKDEENGKKHRILFSLIIIHIILFFISSIGFICVKNDFEIYYANNEKNLVKNIMKISSGSNTNVPIRVEKDGKWGYIDINGKTIVDFMYNDCTEFIKIVNLDTNKNYYIALISIGNELKIITNDNKVIASYKNNKKSDKIRNCTYKLHDLRNNLEEAAKSLNIKIKIYIDNEYSSEKENRYNSNWGDNIGNLGNTLDTISFEIKNNNEETQELLYNTETKSITYNGRKVNIDGYLYIYNDEYDFSYIDTYKNGYIPIYNFDKEVFGWIDLNGQTHYINGKKQILDFNDNYIAIKDYSVDSDVNICIINYDGEIVSDYFKEITVLDKGFVVKKQNDKNVYLNDNLEEITEEYDIIDTCKENDGILIVSNLNRNNLDNLSYDLININNGKIIGDNFEYVSGMSDEKYNANDYNDDISKLYEKYYK